MASKYHEHHEHERVVAMLTIVTSGTGLLLLCLGWYELPKPIGAVEMAVGVALLPMAFGLWRAKEWARLSVGLLTIVACIGMVAYTTQTNPHVFEVGSMDHLLTKYGVPFVQAVFLLLPSTKRKFADARAAMQREVEARGAMRGSRSAYRRT